MFTIENVNDEGFSCTWEQSEKVARARFMFECKYIRATGRGLVSLFKEDRLIDQLRIG